jgi:hypothetical protein
VGGNVEDVLCRQLQAVLDDPQPLAVCFQLLDGDTLMAPQHL